MNFYCFVPYDQPWNNWLLFREIKEKPWLAIRTQYADLICPKCGKFDFDQAFRRGFDPGIRIRSRGDFFQSSEGFLCISKKVRQIMQANLVDGMSLKPCGLEPWYVVNVSLRVKADARVLRAHRPFCRVCKRPDSVTGVFDALRQVEVPAKSGVIFTTIPGGVGSDRDVFVSKDVVELLKAAGIKGGQFRKLLTPEEESLFNAGLKKGKARWPDHSIVYL